MLHLNSFRSREKEKTPYYQGVLLVLYDVDECNIITIMLYFFIFLPCNFMLTRFV